MVEGGIVGSASLLQAAESASKPISTPSRIRYAHDRNNDRAASFEQTAVPGLREGCGPRRLKMSIDLGDPFDLARFLQAQDGDYDTALSEIRGGRKESHWMWYIFPQFEGLGLSTISRRYSIKSRAEAGSLPGAPDCSAHDWSNARRRRSTFTAARRSRCSAHPIMSKLQSSATLFALVSPPGSVFQQILKKYFKAGATSGRSHWSVVTSRWWLVVSVAGGSRAGRAAPAAALSNCRAACSAFPTL